MLNASHLLREASCPGCGVTYTFQEGEKEKICTFCRNIVRAPEPEVNTREVESLLAEGDKLCNALEFREAWYYYRRAKELDPACVKAYWGLIRAAYGVQIVFEDKTETRFVLSTLRVPQDVEQCEEWHVLREKLKGQPRELLDEYSACIKNIRVQQQNMKKLWSKGWQGEYDIYLCYKETERYEDTVTRKPCSRPSKDQEWVRAFYEELNRQNLEQAEPFRIFYAPVTLSNAAGDPYAAHLSHALMTSRVMLLMGTQPEYFDTSWVLGERMRFYHYMEEENYSRKIIPVFNHLLTGGKSFEEVIPKEHMETQGIDVAGDMESAVRNVLARCAEILTQERGQQPGLCQHVVREKEYDILRGENARLMQALGQKESALESALRNREKLEREKDDSAMKLREAMERNARFEADVREKDKAIKEMENLNYKAGVERDNARRDVERLQNQNLELMSQKAEAEANAKEKNREIERLKYKTELDRESAHQEVERLQTQNQELLDRAAEAEAEAREKKKEVDKLKFETRVEQENARKEIERLREEIAKLQKESGAPEQPPDPPSPPAKASYQLKEYGFRQSTGPNGPTHYGSDLLYARVSENKLSKIDEIYAVIRSRKSSSVNVTIRLEGVSGQYSAETRARLDSNRITQVSFSIGKVPLNRFSGEFILTITDEQGETVHEQLKLKSR